MLKAKQLTIAKLAFDTFMATSKGKVAAQIVRLNGHDSTLLATGVGSVEIGWFGKVSSKITSECKIYPVPVDWDNSEESLGALATKGGCHDMPSNVDALLSAAESSMLPIVGVWTGVRAEQLCVQHKEAEMLVSSGHTLFFLSPTKHAPSSEPIWANCVTTLPNTLFTIHEGTKVEITEVIGEWCCIHVGNNVGWMPLTYLERI